jgi:hypothetical protein
MKMGNTRKLLGLVTIPADYTAAVSENTDNTAVFPVGSSMNVGKLHHTEKILHGLYGDLIFDIVFVFLPLTQLPVSGRTQNLAMARIRAGPTRGFHVLPSFTSIIILFYQTKKNTSPHGAIGVTSSQYMF